MKIIYKCLLKDTFTVEIRLFLAALQRFKFGQNPLHLCVNLARIYQDGAKNRGRIYYVTDLMKSLEN